jgi:hypothetical protein
MFDVNQITTTLRGMADRALQQYAMMNKGNPYVLSLAVAESNQRKQLRAAAQAKMAGQPQPKVVDQDIAGIAAPAVDAMGNVTGMAAGGLPEDQGIARIPAPNIKHMADGGIAGYDDEGMAQGGSMFDFAQHSEPVLRMAGGGEVKRYAGKAESLVRTTNGGKTWFLDIPDKIRDPSVSWYREIPNPLAALADQKFPSREAALQAYNAASTGADLGMPAGVGMPAGTDVSTLEQPAFVPPAASAAPAAPAPAATGNVAAPTGNAPPKPPVAAPGAGTGGPSLKNTPTPMNTGIGDLNTMVGEARNRYLRNANSTVEDVPDMETLLAKRKALMPQGKAYEETEASIKKEEAAEPAEKEKAGLMALMQGFLAVAAGDSPYALTNIAKGMGLGLKEYGDSLKEFKKAGKERQKQMAEIEQARRAEDRGDVDKASALYESAQDREQRRRANIDAGLASLESHGISGAASLMGHEISGKYSLAGHQISANAQKDWMKEIRGGQLVENAMKDLREQINKSDKYGTQAEKDAAFKTMWPQVLQMNPGLAKYAGAIGGGGAPTGGADFTLDAATGQLVPRK